MNSDLAYGFYTSDEGTVASIDQLDSLVLLTGVVNLSSKTTVIILCVCV